MFNVILVIFLLAIVDTSHGSFLPAADIDQNQLKTITNTIQMDLLFQREYDKFMVYVSGPENSQEKATTDSPMNGRIPINVHQDIRGSKERSFLRWSEISKDKLQDKEFIFIGEGTGGGSRALVLAAYWKDRYEQITGLNADLHQIKVITFNADSFGDNIFQQTINRTIEKESILNFYVKKWGDYLPFFSYLKPFFAGLSVYDYMFSRETPYATQVPISIVALCQENYLEIFKHLLGISFCGWVTKLVYSRDNCERTDAEYALGAALLPIAFLYSAHSSYKYLSHLIPSASVAHKSLGNLGDRKKKNNA